MKKLSLVVMALCFAHGSVEAQQADIEEAVRTITDSDFAWRVGVIAHDSMQGRNTPSPGLDLTAAWIASEFRRMGLRGGAEDGSFIQRYPLVSAVVDTDASGLSTDRARLRFGPDVLPLRGATSDGEVTGEIVLISGSGEGLAGLARSIQGRHAVLVLGDDARMNSRVLFGQMGALWSAGAVSVLVSGAAIDGAWDAMAARALQASVRRGWSDEGGSEPEGSFQPMLQIRTEALERLLEGADVDLSALRARYGAEIRADEVPGVGVTLRQEVRSEEITAPNVVGILEGSDPELRDEYVVFSGHMDHVGIGTPDENGDSIFNGADDDASGTVAVVEVAEAMASLAQAPRRSMIFLLVSGEEKGLWGSDWYARNPGVPVENLVANLNTDMVGRNWPDTIVAIGKEHSDLGETLERVNGDHPELRMTAIDDIWPEERFYFRSDHYNFARRGIPVLFFFNGTHEDYHGRDDEPDRIDAEKAARIAKLVFYLGVDIGNAAARPRWNPESYARIVSDR